MADKRLIKNWEELAQVEESNTHRIEIEEYSGWIYSKATGEFEHYLSTHTFYGHQHEHSTKTLQDCGFDVEIANWDVA